jgi:putative membrane protein
MKYLSVFKFFIALKLLIVLLVSCKCDDSSKSLVSNQSFVDQAEANNSFAIKAGNLAIEKGENLLVKQYGQLMIDEYTALGKEINDMASSKEWFIRSDIYMKQKEKLDTLKVLEPLQFDKAYLRIMIDSHQDIIRVFERASKDNGITDQHLRSFIVNKLPLLYKYQEKAQSIKSSFN